TTPERDSRARKKRRRGSSLSAVDVSGTAGVAQLALCVFLAGLDAVVVHDLMRASGTLSSLAASAADSPAANPSFTCWQVAPLCAAVFATAGYAASARPSTTEPTIIRVILRVLLVGQSRPCRANCQHVTRVFPHRDRCDHLVTAAGEVC